MLPLIPHNSKLTALALMLATPFLLTACGGGGDTGDKVKAEYDRFEDKVSNVADDILDDYKAFEDKLTDDEKSMATILESVFLPESHEEDLKKFLDKITPEGGKGGLYVGHFVEVNDGDNGDIDIGGIYFDISKDFGGTVDGRISYQQQPCQDNKTLATDSAYKVDNFITGKLSGSLDTLKFLDIKYVRDLDIETPNLLTTFSGEFDDGSPAVWTGNFQYQDGLGGTKLSAGEDNCHVTYTIGNRANYTAYPLDYQLGTLNAHLQGTGSATTLKWTPPKKAKLILVSQVNVNKANSGANGFERNQVFNTTNNGQAMYSPYMTNTPTNYAFVVQAFDTNNKLIAFDAVVRDVPKGR